MIEFANSLDRLVELPVIARKATNLGNAFATHAQLSGTPTAVAHRQDEDPMPFAARAFRAVFAVPDSTLQQ